MVATGPRRPRLTGPPGDVRTVVLARDRYRCIRCGRSVLGAAYRIHNRHPGGAGLLDPVAALITLCGTCPHWMARNPHAARRRGWLLVDGQPADERPVLVRGRDPRWMRLDHTGGRTTVPHPTAA